MAELTTKTLNELPTVSSVASTDHVLIESGGRMKRADSSLVGGAAYVLYGRYTVRNNTTIYNGLLRAIDEGRPVIIMDSNTGNVIYVAAVHVFSNATIGGYMSNNETFIVTPSNGYSSSDLYTPQNITPAGTYGGGAGPK